MTCNDKGQMGTLVRVFTQQHSYLGYLKNRGLRIADAIADANSESLELLKTHVTTLTAPSACDEVEEVLLRKSQISLVVPEGKHEALEQRLRRLATVKRKMVVVCLPSYTLAGALSLPPRSQASMLLNAVSALPRFIAINDVAVRSSLSRVEPFSCPTVLVQRDHIESIAIPPVCPMENVPAQPDLARQCFDCGAG